MAEDHLKLESFLCFAIHSAAQAVSRASKPLLDELGLTYPQYLAMVVLWAEDDQTVGRIGEKLYLESNTVTPLLKRLEAAGYVRRVRDPNDERQVRVRLSEQGRALYGKANRMPGWIIEVFGGDLEEAHALRERITALRDRLLPRQR